MNGITASRLRNLDERFKDLDPRPFTDIMRTGRMIFFDGFETTPLLPLGSGNLAGVRTTTAGEVFRGEGAGECTTPAVQWQTSGLSYYVTGHLVNINTLIGMAGWFAYTAGSSALDFLLYLDDGANRHEAHLRFNQAQARLEYMDALAAYVAVPGGGIANMVFGSYYWQYMKVVFDPTNDQYEWVYFSDLLLDLSALDSRNPVANNAHTLSSVFSNTAQTAAAASAMIDDVVLTIEEPTYAQLLAALEYEDLYT